MLAITQPLRVGDWVTFEDNYGVVDDVRLNVTILRTGSDVRVVIPNERLAAGILRNDTLDSDAIGLDVSVWLPPEADAGRALEVLGDNASIDEVTHEGVRIKVTGDPVPPPQKGPRQAELRAECLQRLREAGLLAGNPAS
jgi:small-conductance mechanosensitive channel